MSDCGVLDPFKCVSIPLDSWISSGLRWVVDNYRPVFQAMKVVGVNALDRSNPLERYLREASVFPLYDAGNVGMSLCCQAASDFPNRCAIGACGCSPMNSHMVKVCNCPNGKCFDGKSCVTPL